MLIMCAVNYVHYAFRRLLHNTVCEFCINYLSSKKKIIMSRNRKFCLTSNRCFISFLTLAYSQTMMICFSIFLHGTKQCPVSNKNNRVIRILSVRPKENQNICLEMKKICIYFTFIFVARKKEFRPTGKSLRGYYVMLNLSKRCDCLIAVKLFYFCLSKQKVYGSNTQHIAHETN